MKYFEILINILVASAPIIATISFCFMIKKKDKAKEFWYITKRSYNKRSFFILQKLTLRWFYITDRIIYGGYF